MNEILLFIYNNLPIIAGMPMISLLTFILARKFPTFAEKTNYITEVNKEMVNVNKELKELRNFYKKECNLLNEKYDNMELNYQKIKDKYEDMKDKYDEIKKENVELIKKVNVLEIKVKYLSSCKKRYYKCLDYIKDVFKIANKKGFINDLPLLDSKIKNDMDKR